MIALGLLGVALLAGGGWARSLMRSIRVVHPLLTLLTTLALSVGGVTTLMLYIGLGNLPLGLASVLLPYMVLMGIGWIVLWRTAPPTPLATVRVPAVFWWIAVPVSMAIVFNGLYWGFYRDDTLGIYAPFAQELFHTQRLIPITPQRNLYELYPQLASMSAALVYWMAGNASTPLATLPTTLLSIGTLGATYLLADRLLGRISAVVAVFCMATLPDFGNWASSGYVDLPMAFYYTLGIVWLLEWERTQSWQAALMSGLLFGWSAWTKNAALVAISLFFTYTGFLLTQKKLSLNTCVIAYSAVMIVAAPWYVRNLVLAGTLTPDTVWAEDAQQGIRTVFALITLPINYGIIGWILQVSVFFTGWQVIFPTHPSVFYPAQRTALFLLYWTTPFFMLWLLFASYDPRFLLLYIPLLTVMAGWFCEMLWIKWLQSWYRRIPISCFKHLIPLCLFVSLLLFSMWHSIDYKRAILDQPFASYDDKRTFIEHETHRKHNDEIHNLH
ncbi:MAG: ArnT family glycosyltransferase [Phototrophicaceae bacterium]